MFVIAEYLEYFGPDFTLNPDISTKQENVNTKQVRLENSFLHNGILAWVRKSYHTHVILPRLS